MTGSECERLYIEILDSIRAHILLTCKYLTI
jgi:hypothetical protein